MSYATLADLASAAPSRLLESVSSEDQTDALDAGSSKADSYLTVRYETPLSSWSSDLTDAVCSIAIWRIARKKMSAASNFQPLKTAYDEAISWLRDVAAGKANIAGADSIAAIEQNAFPEVYSEESRGY